MYIMNDFPTNVKQKLNSIIVTGKPLVDAF
jgi:hypothetical protein